MALRLESTAFAHGKAIPKRHTGDGDDASPALSWTGVPGGARELALIVDDPDAPTADPWVHWLIYKIPANATGLTDNVAKTPAGPTGAVQGYNSWSKIGYGGPAPPRGHGTHHYHFRLYVLDAALAAPAGVRKSELLKAMEGHVIAEAELIGTYERK